MQQITGLDYKIREMASRIRGLREIEGITQEEMATKTDVSLEEYRSCEMGIRDLNFAFIYRCALALNVDVTDIIEGHSPTLKTFTVTKHNQGQEIANAHGMTYYNLAYAFQNRIAEPLYVKSCYDEAAQQKDIELTTHEGQELDIIISGRLRVQIGEHTMVLDAGDTVYYNSSTPHGMIAVDGKDCEFYAIVLNPTGEPIPELLPTPALESNKKIKLDTSDRIYKQFIDVEKNKNGTPTSIKFKNTESFNFAYDIIDKLAKKKPDKLAMLHVSKDMTERKFTFSDISKAASRCANYFSSIGIQKGDRVLLSLKRHYQFWFALLGLNKIGAIAIPATSQLQAHDYKYRFDCADVCTVICDSECCGQIEEACKDGNGPSNKIVVGERVSGWRYFDDEYIKFSSHYDRTPDSPGGDDLMIMFFTSGTQGHPKLAAHSYKYVLGHFHTAKYWHCCDPDGLHFTISDTGWAKAMWGKMYGQWLCEAAIFVYDFDRFDAAEILPMFKKYNITTFCAPPTMLRMMIKQDISKYDFSSVTHMTTAGEALNPEVYRQFEKATGLQILEGYGQSESTMIIGNLRGTRHKIGSMGKAVPIYNVELLDPNGKRVANGETGEICINIQDGMPCGLFTGYYGDKQKTDEAIHDGYYHTGDTAWQDEDGYYWYVGRVDDVIKSSGYRIGPFEIESVIMELPYILECGVSGAPDEVRGQIIKASIVLTQGTQPTEELKKEIQSYVKKRTAPYKYPRLIVFKNELPKTVTGKIQRNKL